MVNPSFNLALSASITFVALSLAAPALAQQAGGGATPSAVGTTPPETTPVDGAATSGAGNDLDAEADSFLSGDAAEEAPADEAEAESEAVAAEEPDEEEEDRGFSHRFQGGLGILVGSGYNFAIAYGRGNEQEYCHQPGETEAQIVCHKRSPVFFDIQASFGVTEGLEVLLEYRLGLIEEVYLSDISAESSVTGTSRPMAFGFGIRYYVSPRNRIKFTVGAILDIDFTNGLDVDVAIRPIFGLQIEIIRWIGVYAQGSVNLSFIRNFGLAFDLAGGLQFRFP